MTSAQVRATRVAWAWCLAYTALATREQRTRRRDEIRIHLWESRDAGAGVWQTLRATSAGMIDDLSWAATLLAGRFLRALGTPVPYLVVAAILPVQAAFAWSWWPIPERAVDRISGIGSGVVLAAAGVALLAQKRNTR